MSEREVQLDQINYKGHVIKVGHPVRVLPTKKGGRDGFDSLVKKFHGKVITDDEAGTKTGKVTGIQVTDPSNGATRILGPERIVPYLRNIEQKAAQLAERKKVVPIKAAAAKKATTAAATKAASTTRAAAATQRARQARKSAK